MNGLMPAVDYTLAKRSTLKRLGAGLMSKIDVCDAHPELLRAAKFLGSDAGEVCPVCSHDELRLVNYVFPVGKRVLRLGPGGRAYKSEDVDELRQDPPVLTCYEVEVCRDCYWNHVRRGFDLKKRSKVNLAERVSRRRNAKRG